MKEVIDYVNLAIFYMKKQRLSEKWIKAAVLGTIWASSEIVLGSFLHNLRIPFSGNILTAIALIILIAASYKWKEKGLFWRAGIICALMKTMSPSAVIFGPMVAIITEAFLLEASVRLLGRTIPAYIIGSILAMSWILFQKIANFIIFYGYNLVELYESIMIYAQKHFQWQFNAVWMPILILLILYALLGIVSAIIGMHTGRKLISDTYKLTVKFNGQNIQYTRKQPRVFNYSISWLIVNLLFIIGCLLLVNYLPFTSWAILILCIVIVWAVRYKRALRQLMRPKFWFFFVIITMVTALVFTRIQSSTISLWEGIQIGLEMNLRAIIMIMGFTVLGTELYNPRIRNYLQKSRFSQLSLALELSFNTLPSMIADIPDVRTMMKKPGGVIFHLISRADERLDQIRHDQNLMPKVFIITGDRDDGKTRNLISTIEGIKSRDLSVAGIYSPKIIENNLIIGYDIVDIMNNERSPFLRKNEAPDLEKIGSYSILPEGLEKGRQALAKAMNADVQLIIIDEVGRLEMRDKGWGPAIKEILSKPDQKVMMTVRREFVEQVIQTWNIESYIIYDVKEGENKILRYF